MRGNPGHLMPDVRLFACLYSTRLAKRLAKYNDEILTFLLHLQVPADNNHAERQIRGAVIMRKNSYGNRSKNGAHAQAVLMSIFRTCNLLKINPVDFLAESVRAVIMTGAPKPLPPLYQYICWVLRLI